MKFRPPRPILCRAFAGFAIALVSSVLAIGGDDTTPPELKSLRFSPEQIDTSTSAAEVTVSITLADDASGVNYYELAFADPSGAFQRTASAKLVPTRSSTESVKIAFPRFSNAGTWTLAHVFLSDASGNTLNLDAEALRNRGFPTSLEVKSAKDTVSPALTALDFTPSEIDTSTGPAGVKVNYTATDDLSGVTYLELSFSSPSGAVKRNVSTKFEATRSVTDSITVPFPRLSEAGTWTLSAAFLADAAGNTLVLDAEGLARLGFRTALVVKSATDTVSPELKSLQFSPHSIDTTQSDATVTIDFTASDNFSGVKSFEIGFKSPSGATTRQGSTIFSPAVKDASRSIVVMFPKSSEPGTWTVSAVMLTDDAGNSLLLDTDMLPSSAGKTLQVR